MIRHIVLIRFRPELGETEIATLFAELHQIRGKISGLLSIASGRSDSPEKMERGYLHGFVLNFSDWDALQAYQDCPDHQEFGAKLVAGAQEGKEGILVFDLPDAEGAT